jgi:hypothetical protein
MPHSLLHTSSMALYIPESHGEHGDGAVLQGPSGGMACLHCLIISLNQPLTLMSFKLHAVQ